jgi:hypothetical protein
MAKPVWYLYLGGDCIGPVQHETLVRMLTENRLHFSDFVWSQGHAEWLRISEVPQFRSYLPEYPSVPVPSGRGETSRSHEAPEAPAETPRKVVPLRSAPKPEAPRSEAPSPKAARAAAAPAPAAPPVQRTAPVTPPISVEEEPKPYGRRMWRVPIDATVTLESYGDFKVVDISEGGLLLEAGQSAIEVGTDVKLHIASPSFTKTLDMTGILVRQEDCDGTRCYGIEFTKVNPAHKRALNGYVASKLQLSE